MNSSCLAALKVTGRFHFCLEFCIRRGVGLQVESRASALQFEEEATVRRIRVFGERETERERERDIYICIYIYYVYVYIYI